MADTPLATRAPESDFHEDFEDQSLATDEQPLSSNSAQVTDSTPSQALSDHCTTDRPLSTTEPPSGSVLSWSNVDVYVSKPSDYPASPARLLLLLPTGAGIHSRNNQHQADLFARQGYLTVMPDLFDKDPAPNSKPSETEENPADVSWLDTFKLKAAETAKSFMLDMWLARHTPEKVMPVIHTVLKQARQEFADAVANGNGIYAVGYCFGGKYVLSLAADVPTSSTTDEQESKAEEGSRRNGPEIKCGTCAHGTLVSMDDVKHLKAPVQIVAVEEDPLFPAEVLDAARQALKENGTEHEIEVYPGVPHGFAVAGDYESKTIIEAQGRAFNSMIRWLNAH